MTCGRIANCSAVYWLRNGWALVFLAMGLAVGVGCGDGRPARVPVVGHVLIDRQPLAGAYVRFVPSNARPSIAKTDADGRFQLGCFAKDDGAVRGTHRVAVIGRQEINGNTLRWFAPKKYAEESTSGLQYEIDKPIDDLKIELTWDGGKPFIEKVH
jgi:hypothetical protein